MTTSAFDANENAAEGVNEYEGAVLGLIARTQPVVRYRLLQEFRRSPTTSYNTSKGSLYPLVSRMIERGFVQSEGKSDRRGSENLRLTQLGQKALADWVLATGPQHSVMHDHLLSRVTALEDLSAGDQIKWIASAKSLLLDKRDELDADRQSATGPYSDLVHATAIALVNTKLEWLDRLLIHVVKTQSDSHKG